MLRAKICPQSCWWEAVCLSPVCEHTAAPSAAAAAIFSVWVLRGPDQPTRSWKLRRDSSTTTGAGTHTVLHNSMGGGGDEEWNVMKWDKIWHYKISTYRSLSILHQQKGGGKLLLQKNEILWLQSEGCVSYGKHCWYCHVLTGGGVNMAYLKMLLNIFITANYNSFLSCWFSTVNKPNCW